MEEEEVRLMPWDCGAGSTIQLGRTPPQIVFTGRSCYCACVLERNKEDKLGAVNICAPTKGSKTALESGRDPNVASDVMWAGCKNIKNDCAMAVPVLYPSPEFEFESPTSPGIVKTPPTTILKSLFVSTNRRASSRTHAKTNIRVQSPILLSPEPESLPHNLAPNQVAPPRHVKAEPRQSLGSPVEVVSPQGPRVGYSFDSTEPELYGVHQSRPWWQLLWTLCSIVFITVFIPMVVFLMPYTRAGRPPPAFSAITRVATVSNVTSSPLTMSQVGH
ncbi:hypothetical protein HPB50_019661 [Hyalomma asiaticum]|uniref:Uncharacterized protein n=1 Tax=Hyalomma asiaticum TaxID=266040 RepID=A0ACB7T5K0_HYAAI|nr:hypothetical protein HPB50_019661 [Hyalomma asiaticum]